MNILMITDNLMKGGKERRLIELLRFFENEPDVRVQIIILRDKIDYPQIFELKKTKLIVLKRKIKKDPFIFSKIIKIVNGFKPQIIHSWGSMPSVYIFPLALLKRIIFINAMITNSKCRKYGSEWFRAKITFPFSDIILSNSIAGLRAYKASPKKGRVIYNGFNFDRLKGLEDINILRTRYSIETPIIIGMVAAFHSRKDYETYLEVADEFCHENKNVSFMAIGDGESKNYYENKYKDNDRIIFTGNVNNVESIVNMIDIGVLLTNSDNHLEGISNSIVEYMAFGKGVIATQGGGTNELIVNKENGLLIESMSKQSYRSALNEMIDSPELRMSLSKRAQKDIQDKFSIEEMANKTLALYNELLT